MKNKRTAHEEAISSPESHPREAGGCCQCKMLQLSENKEKRQFLLDTNQLSARREQPPALTAFRPSPTMKSAASGAVEISVSRNTGREAGITNHESRQCLKH
jgi:hypothetical protein